ncbi:MAG: ABC transporter ATP-binding protein, partial [Candidatus Krumholzibacteria bacterium]|nr:ABC transporter ATP-binding protein [Candidatus Krumholzibacteria bacterium]
MNVVDFNGIHRAYKRGVDVLKGVTFSVGSSEVVGLLGKNGAGKTTLIRIAMGMLEAQQGTVRIFDMDPRKKPLEVKRRVGYVSEDQILPPFLRVSEVVDLHRGLFPNWDDEMAKKLSQRFNLSPRAKIGSLSKGQARQVALLCAVSHRPELLLLDEPAGGLDPAARREFLETSIQLLNEAGSTILFSSHHMTDVERMAGRVVMIHEGNILVDSGMDDLREGYSIALVPYVNGDLTEKLMGHSDCLAVRERSDAMHAVFSLNPEQTSAVLSRDLGVTG